MNAFLIFSHRLTRDQESDLRSNWKVERISSLPTDLQMLWSKIPPQLNALSTYLEPIRQWLQRNAKQEDLALIQGDFGATYILVEYALGLGVIPLYATTWRTLKEEVLPDGEVRQQRIFKHERFRVYGR